MVLEQHAGSGVWLEFKASVTGAEMIQNLPSSRCYSYFSLEKCEQLAKMAKKIGESLVFERLVSSSERQLLNCFCPYNFIFDPGTGLGSLST